jgi:hypothetical protein
VERAQNAQRVLGWFVLLGAVLQFFLAGLAVFRAKPHNADKLFHSSAFDAHRVVGDALILGAFAIFILAIVNRDQVRIATVLFVLMLIQFGLASAGESVAALGALHPVNGLLIVLFAHLIARGPAARRRERRRGKGAPAEPGPEKPASA